jgi:hypothetical protein
LQRRPPTLGMADRQIFERGEWMKDIRQTNIRLWRRLYERSKDECEWRSSVVYHMAI